MLKMMMLLLLDDEFTMNMW